MQQDRSTNISASSTHKSKSSSTTIGSGLPSKTTRSLPADYQPNDCTVVVAKGGLATKSLGNATLRKLVRDRLDAYSAARTKKEKTIIVDRIRFLVNDSNLDKIGFVKFHKGLWYASSENGARDIISARFRDCLPEKFKSASSSKVAKRRISKSFKRALQGPWGSADTRTRADNTPPVVEPEELDPLPLDAPSMLLPILDVSLFHSQEDSKDTLPVMALPSKQTLDKRIVLSSSSSSHQDVAEMIFSICHDGEYESFDLFDSFGDLELD